MIAEKNYGAHSAQVKMRLIVNGQSIRITHMGPDFLLVDCSSDYPAGEATIMMWVDESESQWRVKLPQGISKDSKYVALALAE
jgi:hypothetical protein